MVLGAQRYPFLPEKGGKIGGAPPDPSAGSAPPLPVPKLPKSPGASRFNPSLAETGGARKKK